MQKLNFLIVDDASFIRDLVKRALKSQFQNCQIDEAANGKKGQTLLTKNQYDLILCDWEMPEMSGLELLQWYRGYEVENGITKKPFMMVTSRGEKEHVVTAVQAGVSEYIGKPFSPDQLLKKVFKLLLVTHKELIRAIVAGTQEKNPFAPASPGVGSNDSASLLTGGGAAPAAKQPAKTSAAQSSAGLLAAGSMSNSLVDKTPARGAAAKGGKKNLGNVDIRTPDNSWNAILRDINLTGASVQIDFSGSAPPRVLEQVVIDIQPKGRDIARINAFVTSVGLTSKALDCHQADVMIHVVDDDNDKMEALTYFVAEVRR
ncbi:response regulator [Reinekea thalattae]|uniref:Response regulator n=1 Tax=Reinekea thalattae TaxID=2593301 RepID=A0A5C8Z2L9_9GAMM|nr:response regulator [Reinekea thalattae]TXR51481.1 response regulator [Reinekea thalattae]